MARLQAIRLSSSGSAGQLDAGELVRHLGFRRIEYVRLIEGERGMRAEAVGVGFRLPVSRTIPLELASKLMLAGTPHVLLRDPAQQRAG